MDEFFREINSSKRLSQNVSSYKLRRGISKNQGVEFDAGDESSSTTAKILGSLTDLDSINTEDFETRFRSVGARQVNLLDQVREVEVTFLHDSDKDEFCSSPAENDHAVLSQKATSTKGYQLLTQATSNPSHSAVTCNSQTPVAVNQNTKIIDLELNDEERAMELMSAKIRSELEAEGFGFRRHRQRIPTFQKLHPVKKLSNMSNINTKKRLFPCKRTQLSVVNKVDMEVSRKLQEELARLNSEILKKIREKQALTQAVSRLKNTSVKLKHEVSLFETLIEENRQKLESARQTLMLTELKQKSATSELKKMSSEIIDKQLFIEELIHQETGKLQQTKCYQEDLEHLKQIVEDWNREKLQLNKEISMLRQQCLDLEREKNYFIAVKSSEYDIVRAELQNYLQNNAQRSFREIADVEMILEETRDQLLSTQADAAQKQELNSELKAQVAFLQHELEKQKQIHDKLLDKNVDHLRTVMKELEMGVFKGTNMVIQRKKSMANKDALDKDLCLQIFQEREESVENLRFTVDQCIEEIGKVQMKNKLLEAKENATETAEKKILQDLNYACQVIEGMLHKVTSIKLHLSSFSWHSSLQGQINTRLAIVSSMLKLKSLLTELEETLSRQEKKADYYKLSISRLNNQLIKNSNSDNKDVTQQLRNKVSRAENNLKAAEDRANKNECLLNQKLVELATLQNSFMHQTREFMLLQRAYSQLKNKQ